VTDGEKEERPEQVPAEVKQAVEKVEAVLEEVPPPAREQALQLLIQETRVVQHRGPLPHPSVLAGYAEVLPDLPQRIVALVERQSSHRMEQEAKLVHRRLQLLERGQFLGAGLVLAVLIGAVYVAVNGHPVLAGTMVTTTIASVLGAFLFGKEPRQASTPESPEPPEPPEEHEQQQQQHRETRARAGKKPKGR
jgi:uncharacterized membrane protein